MVLEYKPEFKPFGDGSGYGSGRLNLDNSDRKIYFIKNEKNIDYLLLSKDFSIEEKISPAQGIDGTIYGYKKERIYLGSMINEKIKTAYAVHYLYDERKISKSRIEEHFRIETIDFVNKKISQKDFFDPAEDEIYLTSFITNNKFHLITCFNKPKQISVRTLDEYGQTTKKDFTLSILDGVLDKEKLFDFLSPAEQFVNSIEFKDDDKDYPVKVFMENEKTVLFTIASQKSVPQLLRLDLETLKADFKEVPAPDLCVSDDRKDPNVNNSYFFKNKLYVLNTCKKKSQLFIFNSATLVLEKKLELSDNSNMTFSEPSTIKKGEKDPEYLTDKDDLIKELNNGAPQIYAQLDSQGNTIISFGMYSENRSGSGGKFIRTPSPPTTYTTGTYSGSNVPITRSFPNPTQMSYQSGSVKIVKTLIKCKVVVSPSNELIKLKTPPRRGIYAWDYVSNFKLCSSCSHKAMISIKDQFYVEYMNDKTQTLYLEEIPVKY